MTHSTQDPPPPNQPRPRKHLGQHFLIDKNIIEKIIRQLQPQSQQTLVEIGPGLGALTACVLTQGYPVHAIEIDKHLYEGLILQAENLAGELTLHQSDALTFDFQQLYTHHQRLRVFGNLPYNISTPLIFHLLKYAPIIDDMLLMLQKEVVRRLNGKPHSKTYGRLSVMVQYYAEVQPLFEISPNAFKPKPKVTSQMVRIKPYQRCPYGQCDPKTLSTVVRLAFGQRRKRLANNLKGLISDIQLQQLGIDPNARAEHLSVQDFVNLARACDP